MINQKAEQKLTHLLLLIFNLYLKIKQKYSRLYYLHKVMSIMRPKSISVLQNSFDIKILEHVLTEIIQILTQELVSNWLWRYCLINSNKCHIL
ncbi:unnamed protein product [Paramecium octaurelia]|uniref:Uncharacterized protein n=1 Tax=Paramecium octaurelia TaxID=43137 RepID=A0A8S1YHB6_PAROT|nr:unnamed protein product [Paramecium octaurelia]